MGFSEYVTALRRRWGWIAAAVQVAIGLAVAYVLLAPPVYEAKSQVFISTNGTTEAWQLYQGSDFTQKRVKSYAEAVSSPLVLNPVIERLELDVTAAELAESVEVTVPLDTVLLEVGVRHENSAVARAVLDAISNEFLEIVDSLEDPSGAGTSPVAVTVLSQAALEDDPVSPRPLRSLAIAVMLGLVAGVVIALMRELLDRSVADEGDVRDVTDTAVLGRIPLGSEASGPAALKDPAGRRAEAFRVLRTNLRFVDLDRHPRSLLVTSSVAGEGKTTTAANLASVMAEDGSSVCLVEADLRSPRLLDYYGFDAAPGLTDVLIGEASLEDVLRPVGDSRVQLIGAGQTPTDSAKLLSGPAMTSLLRELGSRFDVVILDGPPVHPVTDAVVLSDIVDGVLLVVGVGVVRSDTLLESLESLDLVHADVVGLVLNRLRKVSTDDYRYVVNARPVSPRGPDRTSPEGSPKGVSQEGAVSQQGDVSQEAADHLHSSETPPTAQRKPERQ